MKAARQVIRSHAARDYAERKLVHAEATIQELRTKLHHAHREKDAAIEAARLATAAKLAAQRSMLDAEASRDRSDRALREALATNRDLQAKLDALARGFETAKAEPAAEPQARLKADNSRREAPLVTAREAALPADCDDAVIQTIRRPVGRPRKTATTAPAPASNKTDGKAKDSDEIITETAGNQKKARNRQPPDKNLFSGGLRAGTAGGHRRPVSSTPRRPGRPGSAESGMADLEQVRFSSPIPDNTREGLLWRLTSGRHPAMPPQTSEASAANTAARRAAPPTTAEVRKLCRTCDTNLTVARERALSCLASLSELAS
jgi:hypothetical protein